MKAKFTLKELYPTLRSRLIVGFLIIMMIGGFVSGFYNAFLFIQEKDKSFHDLVLRDDQEKKDLFRTSFKETFTLDLFFNFLYQNDELFFGDDLVPIYSVLPTNLTLDDDYPINTRLVFEIGSNNNIIYVSNADRTKVYHLNISTGTRTQLDVDPSNTSGDNKSRDHNIREAYHDRDNSIIYFIDCDQPGSDFDVWYLDYSGSETSPSVTEVGTSSSYVSGTVNVHDIIRHGSSTYALISYENPTNTFNADLFDVTSSPFSIYKALKDTFYTDFLPFVISVDDIHGFFTNPEELISRVDIGALGGNDFPWGICWNGSHWFVIDYADAYVYEYDGSFSLLGSYDIGALGGNDAPTGIEWDGTNFFVLDDDGFVYKYPSNFGSLTTSYDLSLLGGNTTPFDICWDGTNWFITDFDDTTVYKYPSNFGSLTTSYDLSGDLDTCQGICWDGSYFYIYGTDGGITYLFKYSSDFSSLIETIDIDRFNIQSPYSIDFKTPTFFLTEFTGSNALVHEIALTTTTFITYNFDTDVTDSSLVSYTTLCKSGNQKALAFDGSDTLYLVLEDQSDSKTYLYSYVISTDTFTKLSEFNIALMLDRNTNTSNSPPFDLEKAFGVESGVNDLQIFQIPRTLIGKLYKIADLSNMTALSGYSIKAITDHYIFLSNS